MFHYYAAAAVHHRKQSGTIAIMLVIKLAVDRAFNGAFLYNYDVTVYLFRLIDIGN